jgi:hypothetical protein
MNVNEEIEKREVLNAKTDEDISDLSQTLKEASQGIIEVNVEEYNKFSKVVDSILKTKMKFDENQVEDELSNVQIDINDVCEFNYDSKLKEVSSHRDYLIETEGKVRSFVGWYEKFVELLSAYSYIMSKNKSEYMKKQEALIRTKDYQIKKEFYEDLLTRLATKRDAYIKKYESVSRIVAYWEAMAKVK